MLIFDNLVERNEYDTFKVRKFNGISFNMFVDVTYNPMKKLLTNDLMIKRGIKFDIAVKVKYYKWQ